MSMADKETRQQLYKEYKELDDQYRKLNDKLSRLTLTSSNHTEHEQLLKIGRLLESKLRELQDTYGIRRDPSREDITDF